MINIFNKEVKSYFRSSAGYIFLVVFLLLAGALFSLTNLMPGNGFYTDTLFSFVFIFLFLTPILTMRTICSETKEKTDQLLLTSPLKIWHIVLGKFFAASSIFILAVVVTFLFPIILSKFGKIPTGEIIGAYIGFILIGMSFISIGIFISSLTDNQVVAAIGTFGALFIIWIAEWISSALPTSVNSGLIFATILVFIISFLVYRNIKNKYVALGISIFGILTMVFIYFKDKTLYEGLLVKCFQWFSLIKRYESFNMGVLSLNSIVYYITFCATFLFLTIQIISRRRWN
ncbi:ABC transporter permease [Haloimpatiens massiliensis]|uniref:ABC transporter permease n=1 Tax=Haloimpatiens massiliensis TaxID=1658110 RepID=UPI000C84F407|nr:ABC transporter permease [Haloimpatiens massiliensis]